MVKNKTSYLFLAEAVPKDCLNISTLQIDLQTGLASLRLWAQTVFI
jgi:hypothetical protein